jgi:hypothetical protein
MPVKYKFYPRVYFFLDYATVSWFFRIKHVVRVPAALRDF